MLVYYFVPFIVSNRYLLFRDSNGHNSVTVQNRTHVYMNIFDHKDLGNHLLQLCPKVVKHPVYIHTHKHTHTHTHIYIYTYCVHTNEEGLVVIRGFIQFLASPVAESSTKWHVNYEVVSTNREYRCVLLIAWQFCTFSTLLIFMQKMLANLFYSVLCLSCFHLLWTEKCKYPYFWVENVVLQLGIQI